ncbi:MAG: hypothetical protein OQK48_06665 [Sulfurimonas sp.]|uniref:hypothetical protein n=1 Tax=Sulfurimonas sp. TaxID=2022749 RepID=UPI002630AED2|nr:hypothetical protein [Sulfurimonas sp.]MCW8894740.1 hypothetical protein [Sulfurimonas sp.]MCW8954615.1 hypothetical protein [Sulfurimonas sp.]MCW9067547.1 hypothetical protein [Sulfurimonas sp.]
MKFIIFQAMILTIIFSGCSTVTEYWPWGEEKVAETVPVEVPVVTEEDYGYVSYIESGDAAIIDARKKDAYYQMYAECNGKYEIVDENSQESTTVSFSNPNGNDFNDNIKKVTIKFICPE